MSAPPSSAPRDPGSAARRRERFVHGARSVELSAWRRGTRLWIGLDYRGLSARAPERLWIDPARGEICGGFEPCRWHLVAGQPPARHADRDPFVRLTHFVHAHLFAPPETDAHTPDRRPSPGPSPGETHAARAIMRRVYAWTRALAIEAAHSCEPALRSEALRLPPAVRWWAYRRLLAEPRGPFRQLLRTAPGVALLAFAASEARATQILGDTIVQMVDKSVPLRSLLAVAFELWCASLPGLAQPPRALVGIAAPEALARNVFGSTLLGFERPDRYGEREAVRRRWSLLVRRAGPRVAPSHLLLPPPLAFAPEDIPTTVRASTRWYRILHASRELMGAAPVARRPALAGLCLALSRAGCTLSGPAPQQRASALAYFVSRTEAHPRRRSCLTRLLARERAWRVTQPRWPFPAELGPLADAPDTPLAPAPVPAWAKGIARVEPVETLGQLAAAADELQNCLRSLAPRALSGHSYIYRAQVGTRPFAIELRPDAGGELHLHQLAGVDNRAPSRGVLTRLRPFFEAHAIETDAGGEA